MTAFDGESMKVCPEFCFCYCRVHINGGGDVLFNHVVDMSWDIHEYILELKNELKIWRDVYWVLWGTINHLTCAKCARVFPLVDIG